MTAKEYYKSTRIVDSWNWTLEMALNFAEEYAEALHKTGVSDRFPIWSTECPSCKTGRVFLFEKGGSGKCDKCKRTYFTDYEEHPELGTPQTEYWLVD